MKNKKIIYKILQRKEIRQIWLDRYYTNGQIWAKKKFIQKTIKKPIINQLIKMSISQGRNMKRDPPFHSMFF